MGRVRRIWAFVWPGLIVLVVLNFVYGAGYFHGRSAGFEDGVKSAKEAMFGAIERIVAEQGEIR